MKTSTDFLKKTWVVWIGAFICCALWGSAFPCIKTGYQIFEIAGNDSSSQILFAGIREHLSLNNVPKPFRGLPIALITAGIMAMAFLGFSGLV